VCVHAPPNAAGASEFEERRGAYVMSLTNRKVFAHARIVARPSKFSGVRGADRTYRAPVKPELGSLPLSETPEPPTQRDVTAGGVRLRVAEAGSGPCVVLLHGLFVDHRIWDGVVRGMNQEFHLVAPDLPGFGESEKPATSRFPYTVEAFAEAIAGLYAGLQIGRAALVGHGLGAAIALTLAARHPELVAHLVLIDPMLEPERPLLENRLAGLPLIGNLVFKQLVGKATFRAYFRERLLSPSANVAPARVDAFYESFNTPAARGSALATLRATSDPRPVLAQSIRVRSPTLLLWGRHDELYPARFGQRLAREIGGAHFELVDAGHAVPEEQPEETARLISRFLTAPPSSQPRKPVDFGMRAPKRARVPRKRSR